MIKCSTLALAACSLLAFSGCSTLPVSSVSGPGKAMVSTELYFGATKPTGSSVSPKEWEAFLANEITPRFPDGLTIVDSAGQWRTKGGKLIREKTKIVIIIHPDTRESQQRIETIRSLYHQRFGQELVLQVNTAVRAVF